MLSADVIRERLAAPFPVNKLGFRPQNVKGNRALALPYIDARDVQDRLDDVVGVNNWQDEYQVLNDGSVVCQLRVRIEGEWVVKTDTGSPSEQPDAGDRLKAAFSDALKRSAVKWGVGRYLYSIDNLWADYDPQSKQIKNPQLPAFAIPKASAQPSQQQVQQSAPKLPNTGEELHKRLRDYDAKLANEKRCGLGALLVHVSQAGVKAGYGDDITRWTGPAIQFAVDTVKAFEVGLGNAANQQQPQQLNLADLESAIGQCKGMVEVEQLVLATKQHLQHGRIPEEKIPQLQAVVTAAAAKLVGQCQSEKDATEVSAIYKRGVMNFLAEGNRNAVLASFNALKAKLSAHQQQQDATDPFNR